LIDECFETDGRLGKHNNCAAPPLILCRTGWICDFRDEQRILDADLQYVIANDVLTGSIYLEFREGLGRFHFKINSVWTATFPVSTRSGSDSNWMRLSPVIRPNFFF
jgi:hypothetical protein